MPATQIRDKKRLKTKAAMGKNKIMQPAVIRRIERDYQILSLRKDGHTVREVAQILGIATSTISETVKRLLQQNIKEMQETTEEFRALQLERLDNLLLVYKKKAEGYVETIPNPKKPGEMMDVVVRPCPTSAQIVLSIETRRSKLLALDVPETKVLQQTGIREYVGINMEDV